MYTNGWWATGTIPLVRAALGSQDTSAGPRRRRQCRRRGRAPRRRFAEPSDRGPASSGTRGRISAFGGAMSEKVNRRMSITARRHAVLAAAALAWGATAYAQTTPEVFWDGGG